MSAATCAPLVEPVLSGDLWVNPETGEVIGHLQPEQPLSEVFSEADAEWALGRILHHTSRLRSRERIESSIQARISEACTKAMEEFMATDPDMIEQTSRLAQVKTLAQESAKAIEHYMSCYIAPLTQFAKRNLKGKSKTVKLLAGSLQLRAQKPKLDAGDDDALAVQWLIDNGYGDAVKRSVLVSKLSKPEDQPEEESNIATAKEVLLNMVEDHRAKFVANYTGEDAERAWERKVAEGLELEGTGFTYTAPQDKLNITFAEAA